MKYIAYGSNMVAEQMACRCPRARLIGAGYISRARLAFCGCATVERTKSIKDRVPVVVWEIDTDSEQRLDRYEGYPYYYRKDEWLVHMKDGSEIKGMIYLMNEEYTRGKALPSEYYYNAIRDAYIKLGFASEIATTLESALRRSQQRSKLV